jgi:hypothetical protein
MAVCPRVRVINSMQLEFDLIPREGVKDKSQRSRLHGFVRFEVGSWFEMLPLLVRALLS